MNAVLAELSQRKPIKIQEDCQHAFLGGNRLICHFGGIVIHSRPDTLADIIVAESALLPSHDVMPAIVHVSPELRRYL
jgi:hypothetical protein